MNDAEWLLLLIGLAVMLTAIVSAYSEREKDE
jgi:hypothetical protein